jgi:hypothetical protein
MSTSKCRHPTVSGACFKFPCGRWLGRSVDDGSLERYLVGSYVPGVPAADQLRDSRAKAGGRKFGRRTKVGTDKDGENFRLSLQRAIKWPVVS